jgi:hypothetical protein
LRLLARLRGMGYRVTRAAPGATDGDPTQPD